MEACYDFFECVQKNCVMHGKNKGTNRWEAEGTY